MKSGFTLIELMIGLVVSSMVAYSIFTVFNQVQKASTLVQRFIGNDAQLLLFQHQFEKDISGTFAPTYWFTKEVETPAPKPGQPPIKKQEQMPIEKIFYSVNENNQFKELTFITCNPLQLYDNYKPRIVRVIYTLKPQEDKTFHLIRKEFLDFDYKKAQESKIQGYQILTRVRSFSLEFMYPEQPEEKKDEKKETKKKEEPSFKTVREWGADKDKNKEQKIPVLPEYVSLKMVLANPYEDAEDSFELRYQIFAYKEPEKKSDPKLSQAQPLQEEGKQPGGAQPQPNALQQSLQATPDLGMRAMNRAAQERPSLQRFVQ